MRSSIAFALAALAGQSLAIPTIVSKGAKFFDSTGQQFYIKGIAYQLTNDDPLATTQQCQLDAALMKTIGANSIRVYHVDPTADHDGCMSAFADAGIYAWIDLDTFSTYILQEQSLEPSWTQDQFNSFARVMDAFHGYDNVAGFFVGNEVLTSGAQSIAAPYVKAAGRDMKAYAKSKGYRNIPIGYSAADIPALRPNLQNYLACGDDSADALDFFGLNAYEWCGSNTFETSGYSELQKNASEYSIPIFFSETGCRVPQPRLFGDQSAILGPDMDGTWSGAIIYEWIEETNDYGLISYGPPAATGAPAASNVVDGYTRGGTPTPIQPGWDNLNSQWQTLNPTGVSMANYSPSLAPPPCPAYTSGFWNLNGNVPLPTLGQTVIANAAAAAITPSGSGSVSSDNSSGSDASSNSGSDSQSGGSETKAAQSNSPTHSSAAISLRVVNTVGTSIFVAGGISVAAFVLGITIAL